jgi:3-deoxy-D-manno-octulosonate 8-phosphate phosphatase (KDO 8-P phosphatase)
MPDPSCIRMLVFDVDGVLTDGAIIINDRGLESKRFHVRDGFAMRAAMKLGIKVGIITGRSSRVVALRAAELGIDLCLQGISDKKQALEDLCKRAGVLPENAAYMGDDLIDLSAMLRCGYPMTVADAPAEVREVAKYVTKVAGGRGAAREAIEHVLKGQNRWDELVEKYAT